MALEITDALLYLANINPHIIDRAADMAKAFKNDVVRLGHRITLSRYRIIVNRGRDVLPEDQREDRSGPAVAPARPAVLRQRRLSGAGLCVSGTISRSRIPRPMDQTGGRIQRQPHLRHRRDQRLRLSRPHYRKAPARAGLQARPAILSRLGRRADGLAGRCSDFRTALAADRGTLAARAEAIPS